MRKGLDMDPDRQERHDALAHNEDRLTNGGRGDVTAMSDALVEMSRSLRVLIATDFVTPETCERNHASMPPRFGWPACFAVVTVAVAVCAIAIPIVTK